GGHGVVVGELALGDDAVLHGVVHIDLVPGITLDKVGGAGVVDAVEPAGQGDGGAHGDVAVGGEGGAAGALHQVHLIGGLDVAGVPGVGGHVGKGAGGVGVDGLEVGQAVGGGQGAGGQQGHRQAQSQEQ